MSNVISIARPRRNKVVPIRRPQASPSPVANDVEDEESLEESEAYPDERDLMLRRGLTREEQEEAEAFANEAMVWLRHGYSLRDAWTLAGASDEVQALVRGGMGVREALGVSAKEVGGSTPPGVSTEGRFDVGIEKGSVRKDKKEPSVRGAAAIGTPNGSRPVDGLESGSSPARSTIAFVPDACSRDGPAFALSVRTLVPRARRLHRRSRELLKQAAGYLRIVSRRETAS